MYINIGMTLGIIGAILTVSYVFIYQFIPVLQHYIRTGTWNTWNYDRRGKYLHILGGPIKGLGKVVEETWWLVVLTVVVFVCLLWVWPLILICAAVCGIMWALRLNYLATESTKEKL